MNTPLGYRFGLYASLALAFVNAAFVLYLFYLGSRYDRAMPYVVYSAILAFGLWVQSKFARYLGGAICWIAAAAVVWPMLSGGKPVVSLGLIWVLSMGVLNALVGYITIFSKRFSREFNQERASQPRYKKILRNGAFIILGIAAAIATLNDILHLASL